MGPHRTWPVSGGNFVTYRCSIEDGYKFGVAALGIEQRSAKKKRNCSSAMFQSGCASSKILNLQCSESRPHPKGKFHKMIWPQLKCVGRYSLRGGFYWFGISPLEGASRFGFQLIPQKKHYTQTCSKIAYKLFLGTMAITQNSLLPTTAKAIQVWEVTSGHNQAGHWVDMQDLCNYKNTY